LHLSNGETLNEKLGQTGSVVDLALAELAGNPEGMVRKAFLQTLSRQPTEAELRELVSELTQVPQEEQRQAVEDFYWSLMSSREFLYHR
ncbi:MAG: S-layer protein, partial [Pirellulaceae bacterium]